MIKMHAAICSTLLSWNPSCRWCCWGPLGLLDDQWTIQTTASGVNGAQSSAAEEAV